MESTQLTDHISATLPSISVPPPTFSEEISEFSDQESNNEAFQKNSLDSTNTTTSNIFEVSNDFLNGSMNNLTLTQNDLLSLDRFFVEDWKDITTPGPSARSGHAMVYVPTANQIVLFGGIGYDIHPRGYIYEDTWVFDLETNNWTQMFPEVYPDARADHAMVYDPELDLIVLYGGINDNPDFGYDECFNDVWFYDLKTNYWDFGDLWGYSGKPSGRCGHSMVYDPFEGHLVVFGGWDPFTDTFFNDTWIFDCYFPFVECYEDTPYLGSSPSPRAYHSMVSVFDPDRPDERIIVLY